MDNTETTTGRDRRFPLANDANGNPINVPEAAVGWRVRKLAQRAGRPKVIFDSETGRPLELALTISHDDFAETVGESGRYRLEAFDQHGCIIAGCIAVTEVAIHEDDAQAEQPMEVDAIPQLVQLVARLVDSNARVMEAMASAFGKVHPNQDTPVVIERSAEAKAADSTFLQKMVEGMMMQFMAKFAAAPAAAPTPGAQS